MRDPFVHGSLSPTSRVFLRVTSEVYDPLVTSIRRDSSGTKKMHPDHTVLAIGVLCDLVNAQGQGVRRKDALRPSILCQQLKYLLFQFHDLRDCLDNEISILHCLGKIPLLHDYE